MERKHVLDVGKENMEKWHEDDYIACLKRAFVRCSAEEVTLDDMMWRCTFLCSCVAWSVEKGLLRQTGIRMRKGRTIFYFSLTTEGEQQIRGGARDLEVACAE